MLLCGETVTLARRTGTGYALTVMEGASWFSRMGTERERAGEAVSGVTRVRIPERILAAAPRTGDLLIRGEVSARSGPGDLVGREYIRVTETGDRLRGFGRLRHWLASGV